VDELDFLLFDYQHDADRVFRDGVDPLNFRIFITMAAMKESTFLLAVLVSFVVQRCACQLLLGACQLTFGMFTFTFYLLESSSRWSILSEMLEARKRICEGKQCCCCPQFPRPSSGGEKPLRKRQNAFSDSYPFQKGERAQHKKRGGRGSSPPCPLTILPAHSSPHLPNKPEAPIIGNDHRKGGWGGSVADTMITDGARTMATLEQGMRR
jgi:hypothetical protein